MRRGSDTGGDGGERAGEPSISGTEVSFPGLTAGIDEPPNGVVRGKPLLVVLRCVPCLACAGIDAQVVLQHSELDPLLDQFVCVRVINANALDLSLFQFDFDLSFSVLFFNGDGTVYGRYGSWTHQKNPEDKTTAGFRRALEAVLALHRDYPGNRQALAGKQGGPTPFKTPVQIPTLAGKYSIDLNWQGKVVPSCVHCHQIGGAFRTWYRERDQPIPTRWIFPFPAPQTIGLTLSPDRIAHVASVADHSIAAHAGLRVGDDLTSLNGEPLVSIADVTWVLHHAPATGSLSVDFRRNGKQRRATLTLPDGWRFHSDISQRTGTWELRGMATGGLRLEDLGNAKRAHRGLTQDRIALLVTFVGQYGKHAAAKKAGFRKGDVIVDVGGMSRRMSEGELIGHLLQEHPRGTQVPVTVLRRDQRLRFGLPMQ